MPTPFRCAVFQGENSSLGSDQMAKSPSAPDRRDVRPFGSVTSEQSDKRHFGFNQKDARPFTTVKSESKILETLKIPMRGILSSAENQNITGSDKSEPKIFGTQIEPIIVRQGGNQRPRCKNETCHRPDGKIATCFRLNSESAVHSRRLDLHSFFSVFVCRFRFLLYFCQ